MEILISLINRTKDECVMLSTKCYYSCTQATNKIKQMEVGNKKKKTW